MRNITQRDIAEELGITRVAVTKALKDDPDISPGMRAKVRHVAQKRGYIPNHSARTLHLNKTETIGVVVPDVSNSFFALAIDGIMDAAAARGYRVMLTVSRENEATEHENIITLLSHRVDGLLVAVSKDTRDLSIFHRVKKMNLPLVFFDRAIENIGFNSVGIDDRKAAADLVNYAVSCGFTKIAHLAGSMNVAIGRSRYSGYRDALTQHNLPLKEEWVISGSFDKDSGYTGFKKLLQSKELPEIVFAANDRIAQGAYKAMKEAGLRIPEDIGVVALGHDEFAEILDPPLTIMHAFPEAIGREAMRLLADEISLKTDRKERHVILDTSLILHGSVLHSGRIHSSR